MDHKRNSKDRDRKHKSTGENKGTTKTKGQYNDNLESAVSPQNEHGLFDISSIVPTHALKSTGGNKEAQKFEANDENELEAGVTPQIERGLFDIATVVPGHALKTRKHHDGSHKSHHSHSHHGHSKSHAQRGNDDGSIPQEKTMSSKNKKGDEEGQASTKAASQLEPPLPTPNKKSRPVRKVKSDPGPDMDDVAEDVGLSFDFLDEETEKRLEDTEDDKKLGDKLSEIMDRYRDNLKEKAKKAKKSRYPKYTYSEIVANLTKQGIPVPEDEDFARLESTHGTRWDPDGTVVEYYSPVLRSFIPINMRGRYRGCWAEDRCIQGLDVSKLGPKPDALEGFIDRNRQERIQYRYDVMGNVATDEGHLDYLIELQKYQTEILPIPIFYEVLNLGMETLNENLKILATEEGYPPADRVYQTTELQARHVRRKLQVYAGLGLESLDSKRKGLGRVHPLWEKTRDEIIKSLLARRYQAKYILRMKHEREVADRLRAAELNTGSKDIKDSKHTIKEDNEIGNAKVKNNKSEKPLENKPEVEISPDRE